MRNLLKWGLLFAMCAAGFLWLTPDAAVAQAISTRLSPDMLTPLMMGAVFFPIIPYTYEQLKRDASPGNAQQPESIPFTFWDQQNYATNWTSVIHFAAIQTDPTLGNIQQAGTLSADQYFRLHSVTLDWIISATSQSSSGAPTIVDDLLSIMNGARAFYRMQMAMKTYIESPFHGFHSAGGINVQYQLGTPTGSALGNYAQNWYADGGYIVNGSMVLPPRQTFTFAAIGVASALVATRAGRVTMWGVLSRKVG
jgi:hypothetical protein